MLYKCMLMTTALHPMHIAFMTVEIRGENSLSTMLQPEKPTLSRF